VERAHLGRFGFSDFDVPLEHHGVHEAELERGECHGCGYGDKVKYGLVPEQTEVIERVDRVSERVYYHRALHPRRASRISE